MNHRGLVFLFLLLAGCSGDKVDTSKIKEEMEARAVRVVPEAEIVERAFALGDSLVNSLELEEAIGKAGSTAATWTKEDVSITCTLYLLEGNYQFDPKEAGVFEAYRYSAQNNVEADPNVQRLADETMVFNAPVIREDQLIGMWSVHLPRKYVILSIRN